MGYNDMNNNRSVLLLFSGVFAVLFLVSRAFADAPAAPAASSPPPMDGYQVATADPANIAPTVAVLPHDKVQVAGQPRTTKGHPCTLWDQEDIDHMKEMLKTSKELQFQFADMKSRMDARIATPLDIPPPPAGKSYPGDYFPPFPGHPDGKGPENFRRYLTRDSSDVGDLATLYALTGDEKYGEYAKKILLAYAHASQYSSSPTTNYRFAQGLFSQLLEEAQILDYYAFAYDLIYNLPSWKPEERTQVHDEWLRPLAMEMVYPGSPEQSVDSFADQHNNRGLIGTTSVLWAGYATDDQELVAAALYGTHLTIEKPDAVRAKTFPPFQDWTAATADAPTHGLLANHFSPVCIPGGMWVEGTPSYSFYALGSMIDAAELAWHHGLDLYRYNDCILKYMFDFPILMSYPDLSTPGENDAHRESMLVCPYPSQIRQFGAPPNLYEYAYRRYQDPVYLAIINNPEEKSYLANPTPPPPPPPPPVPGAPPTPPPAPGTPPPPYSERHLNLTKIGVIAPSILYDLDPSAEAKVPPPPSVNYALVGFGILRTPAASGDGIQGLIMSYGPTASHGHPDKLHLDLYAFNDVLMPTPGVNFPYNNPNIPKWLHTTLAHNTLTVDEKSQDYYGSNQKSTAHADQLVYAPASTVGMERAWTNSVYDGVTMDRSSFMTPNYLADIFGAFSPAAHKYDLAWHIRGDATSDLTFTPTTFDPNLNGYNWFTSARAADATDKPWTITSTRDTHVARLHVAGGPSTQAIIGDGGFYNDETSGEPKHHPPCPTIIERRDSTSSTIYGNALDFTGGKDGYVKDVSQEGGLDTGYALLKVTTTAGTDLCFASYKPGNYKAGGLQTDALQAFVQMNGPDAQTLYLAGGKALTAGGASITRSDSGLAYVEKTLDGNYIVGNPSPTDATVTVTLNALKGLSSFTLDDKGQKGAAVTVTANGSAISLSLKAGAKVLFAKP